MIKIILTISLLFVFLGCASTPMFKPSKTARMQFLESNNITSPTIKEAIINGEVVKGMTKSQVRAVWGEPDNIYNLNQDGDSVDARVDEQWEYRWDLLGTNKTVEFKNGIVVWIDYDYT